MTVPFEVFRSAEPELAAFVRERLHGRVSYLATVRADGSPRVHPVTPGVGDAFEAGAELFIFMEPTSPKGRDLERGSRFALHAGVEDDSGGAGEVLVGGVGVRVDDADVRALAVAACPYEPRDRYVLYVLRIDEVQTRRYEDAGPVTRRWRARE